MIKTYSYWYIWFGTHTHATIYIYIYVCVCVWNINTYIFISSLPILLYIYFVFLPSLRGFTFPLETLYCIHLSTLCSAFHPALRVVHDDFQMDCPHPYILPLGPAHHWRHPAMFFNHFYQTSLSYNFVVFRV